MEKSTKIPPTTTSTFKVVDPFLFFMRKYIIYSFLGIVVIAAIVAALVLFRQKTPSPVQSPSQAPSLPGEPSSTPVAGSDAATQYGNNPTFVIATAQGGVTVRNFYLDNPPLSGYEDGSFILKDDAAYTVFYIPAAASFRILVADPFSSNQAVSENAILNILDVLPSDACKLDIRLQEISGLTHLLSFCPSKLQ